jgi:hypothetical protein
MINFYTHKGYIFISFYPAFKKDNGNIIDTSIVVPVRGVA